MIMAGRYGGKYETKPFDLMGHDCGRPGSLGLCRSVWFAVIGPVSFGMSFFAAILALLISDAAIRDYLIGEEQVAISIASYGLWCAIIASVSAGIAVARARERAVTQRIVISIWMVSMALALTYGFVACFK